MIDPLTTVGALALAGQARAADMRAVDVYSAITGSASRDQAVAGELCPLDARVVTLDEGSAVVYHTYVAETGDVVRVAMTVGTDPDGAGAFLPYAEEPSHAHGGNHPDDRGSRPSGP